MRRSSLVKRISLMMNHGWSFSRDTNDASRATTFSAITACGFLECQPNRSGMKCAFHLFMAQGRTMLGVLIAVGIILIGSHKVTAQQSTAPPSSLSTRPLTSEHAESKLRPSCDLCRKPEEKPTSALKPYRLQRDKGSRPHKSPKGVHRSFDQSLKSTLPRRQITPPQDSRPEVSAE